MFEMLDLRGKFHDVFFWCLFDICSSAVMRAEWRRSVHSKNGRGQDKTHETP